MLPARNYFVSVVSFVFVLACVLGPARAQRGPRGPQRGPQLGRTFELELLRNEAVIKELELVDDQIQSLRELGEQIRGQSRQLFGDFRGFRDLSREEREQRFAQIREQMESRRREIRQKIDQILLPHQSKRLSQILLQMRLRGAGTARALASSEIREALGITDEQIQKLREADEQQRAKLNEQIQQLREQARKAVLQAALTPEQVQKFEEMVGEPFQMPQPERGGGRLGGGRFGGGGPDAGGFGGRRFGGDRGRGRPRRPNTE